MCRGQFLAACIGLFLSWHYHGLSVATEPGYLDFDNLPETNFSCEGKVIGGYYADTETGCQMFHVCTIGQKGEITDIKFLCLNGTVFDQETRVCERLDEVDCSKREITDIKFLCLNGTVFDQETRVCERLDEVDCSKSESFYDLNLELYNNQGAGYGIQPENEESQDDTLCEEEDEEECKTEKPTVLAKSSPTEQVQASSAETDDEETTTQQPPLTSSTTSRRPIVTSTSFPSTTPAPQILQYPSSSPETIAALLALHKAFTQSLQQHSNNKEGKVNPQKLTGFVESLDPLKSTQQAETFEIKSVPTSPTSPRQPTLFSVKTQSQFDIQQTPLKTQLQSLPRPHYQSQSKPDYQSQPKPLYQSQPKPQYQIQPKVQYQRPPKPQFLSPLKPQFLHTTKPQFQSSFKAPQPPSIPQAPVHFAKPVQATSERYGNTHFHHSFHINTQIDHFPDNYHDQYSDHESQPSSQPQTEAPKQYDFNDYEDDYYDEKPQTSTITPYLLHQLKVNQVRNANQAKSSSINHGSFVREVSSPTQAKPFSIPSFRSVTTPGIAIITATSTTSSSSVKTSKPVLSAIRPQKETLIATRFDGALLHSSDTNITRQFPNSPQSYDDYIEGDVHDDPFFKDVPKIGRIKRSILKNLKSGENFLISNLTTFNDELLYFMLKFKSEFDLDAIVRQYCKDKNKPVSSSVSFCSYKNDFSLGSENKKLDYKWKIVNPTRNSNYIHLLKSRYLSNKNKNSPDSVVLLIDFPDELKPINDSIKEDWEDEEHIRKVLKRLDLNSSNRTSHHRLKRFRRNRSTSSSREKVKSTRKIVPTDKKIKGRGKREVYDEMLELSKTAQPEIDNNQQTYQRIRGRTQGRLNYSRQPQLVSNLTKLKTEELPEQQKVQRIRQRRPQSRRPSLSTQSQKQRTSDQGLNPPNIPQRSTTDENLKIAHQFHSNPTSVPRELEPNSKSSKTQSEIEEDVVGRPSSKRRGQGKRYHWTENIPTERNFQQNDKGGDEIETSTTYPFNLKPGTQFSCDDKIKGGYYADMEAECYGYFICSQGEINGPLLKSHFWCGPTTKFNQRSRTCQTEANVACSVSQRYFHLNKDILSLPDPEDSVKDSLEPSKV